jgi:hypothetical protein
MGSALPRNMHTASRTSIAIILMRHEEISGEFVESTKDLQTSRLRSFAASERDELAYN